MAPILTVKAGRAQRRSEDSNWVDPMPAKGKIELEWNDDLLSFAWKSREASSTDSDDEYVLFPGDCTFSKVQQDPSGRTYVLKFSSSDQRLFFYLQNPDVQRHAFEGATIDSVIQDPEFVPRPFQPSDAVQPTPAAPAASTAPPATPAHQQPSTTEAPGAPRAQRQTNTLPEESGSASVAAPPLNQEQVDAFTRLLGGYLRETGSGVEPVEAAGLQDEPAHLTDILSPANLVPVITADPSIITTLLPHLPPTLPLSSPPTTSEISEIVSSPQFQEAVAGFDAALRTGGLAGLMSGLGLPARAGSGVREFLDAVQEQGKKDQSGGAGTSGNSDDRMDTD